MHVTPHTMRHISTNIQCFHTCCTLHTISKTRTHCTRYTQYTLATNINTKYKPPIHNSIHIHHTHTSHTYTYHTARGKTTQTYTTHTNKHRHNNTQTQTARTIHTHRRLQTQYINYITQTTFYIPHLRNLLHTTQCTTSGTKHHHNTQTTRITNTTYTHHSTNIYSTSNTHTTYICMC